VGLSAGASFALKEYLHISAFERAVWPSTTEAKLGVRGEGAVKLALTEHTTIAHAMEAFGITRVAAELHTWDYTSGPVLQLPEVKQPVEPKEMSANAWLKKHGKKHSRTAAGLANPQAEALLNYASTVPISPKGKKSEDAKLREIDQGKVAFGFNKYGLGNVLIGGPHPDIDQANGELPDKDSIEDKLVKFLMLYVSPCMGEKLQRAGWWEHTGLAFVYIFLVLSFLSCGGTMWLLQYWDRRDERHEDHEFLRASSEGYGTVKDDGSAMSTSMLSKPTQSMVDLNSSLKMDHTGDHSDRFGRTSIDLL